MPALTTRFTREIELRPDQANGSDSIPCTLSTETAVNRGDYDEILSHTPGHVDLKRCPLPVLTQHDTSRLNVAVIENVVLEGGKLRGDARFGCGAQAQEILADIKSGVVRYLSVGYELTGIIAQKGRETRFSWAPYECSIVAVPADPNAGFFRSQNSQNLSSQGKNMTDITVTENNPPSLTRSQARSAYQAALDERERVQEIHAIGRVHNMADLADKAIEAGTSIAAFRAQTLSRLKDSGTMRMAESPELGLSRRELEQYSFVKAILSQDPTYAARHGGIEVEASRAMAQKLQKDPRGLFVPPEALHGKRDLEVGTPSAGGYLRPTDHLGDGFIDLLRAQSLILKLNPTRMQALRGDTAIPRKTASATASWIAESAPAIESQPAFGQLVLRPRTIAAMTDFSRKTLLQSSPDVEALVRMDLAAILGTGLDKAIVNGSGIGAEPLGILGTTGVALVSLGANGGAITWDAVLEMERLLASANADAGNLAYLTTPAARKKLKSTLKVASVATGFIWSDGSEPGAGLVNGYAALASTSVPSDLVKGTGTALSAAILGNWSDLVVGDWSGLDLVVDPYTFSSSGTTRVVALMDVDLGLRRAESFCVIKDALTT